MVIGARSAILQADEKCLSKGNSHNTLGYLPPEVAISDNGPPNSKVFPLLGWRLHKPPLSFASLNAGFLRHREASLTDNHWSVREKVEAE